MGDREKGNTNLDVSKLNLTQVQALMSQNLFITGSENVRRMPGNSLSHPPMPPVSPVQQMNVQKFAHSTFHSRSLSHPPVFNLDSTQKDAITYLGNHDGVSDSMLSQLPPSGAGGSSSANREGLPPRKVHRPSMSDLPFGINNGNIQPPPLPPLGPHGGLTLPGGQCGSSAKPAQLAYMNYNSVHSESNQENMGYRASSSKTKGSDNDTENSANESGYWNLKEGLKRSSGGGIAPTARHQTSISMDSFMRTLQLNGDSSNLQASRAGVQDGQISTGLATGSELGNKVTDEKLAEIAMNDPKRAKRIIANRQSAARSKERKMRYTAELERRVETLQNEAAALSAQVAMLHNGSQELQSSNAELKLRLSAMEQQSQFHSAVNEALNREIQRLRVANAELSRQSRDSNSIGFANFQTLLAPQEPSNSTIKSESNGSHEE